MSSDVVVVSYGGQAKLSGGADLREVDVGQVKNFWRTVQRIPAGAAVTSDPEGRKRQVVVVSGWLCEVRILPDGRRQIFAFLLPGDVASLSGVCDVGSRGLVALTSVEIADATAMANGDLASASIADAIRRGEERLFDHIVRIGRLTARERVLNLLFELHDRLEVIGLVRAGAFRLPLTQEVFADALGLSVVHINRTLQRLQREGFLTIGRGVVTLHEPHKHAAAACYQTDVEPVRLER
jgi:CRP-like cAMP-binding protein